MVWTSPDDTQPSSGGDAAAAAAAAPATSSPDPPGDNGDHGIEALRQRGLAKLLNKHFTETTKKLATEKAAADAALRDLEARKANGGEATSFVESPPNDDNNEDEDPLDSLYTSVHQWRNECRRKERETLLLYQRYVHKFGSTGNIKLPPASPDRADVPFSPDAASAKPGVPPPSDSPLNHPSDSPPAVMIPTSRMPTTTSNSSAHAHHFQLSSDYLAPVLPSAGDDEFRNFYRRQLEARNKSGGGGGANMKIAEDEPAIDAQPNIFDPFMPTVLGGAGGDDDDDEDDEDDISMISGLTSVNSAMTKQILNDCEQTVVTFLQEEKKAIQVLMDKETDSQSHKSNPSALGSVQSHAAQEAENMAKKMQEILHDFQKTKADQEKLTATKGEGRPYETSNPEENWAVYYDESYQREYYHESNANKTQWEPPEQTPSSDVTSHSTSTGEDEAASSSRNSAVAAAAGKTGAATASSSVLESIDVMPEVHERVSRIALYRRKRRRKRKRRILLGVFCLLLMAAFSLYYTWSTNPERVRGWVAMVDNVLHTDMAGMKTKEQQEQERKAHEAKIAAAEAARLAKEAKAKAEEEARQREIKRREKEKLALQKAREKTEAERIAAEAKAAAEAERIAAEERRKELHRPWGCNIPLAYVVNERCRRLADANPIFDPLNEFMPLD